MAHLITFKSGKFDVSGETPNPVNPIFGESVVNWLGAALRQSGYQASDAAPEDWGWYIDVRRGQDLYFVGASSDGDDVEGLREWTIQIHKPRTFMARLRGQRELSASDELTATIETVLRRDAAVSDMAVDKQA